MTTIRAATVRDADAIAALHMRTWQAAYRELMPAEFLAQLDVPARAERWRRNLAGDGETFVIEDTTGQIAGFCSLLAASDEDVDRATTGAIAALYIDQPHWRSGLGKALMRVATERARARGFRQLLLWVLEGNQSARRFYEQHGFVTDGYSKTEDYGGTLLRGLRYVTERV